MQWIIDRLREPSTYAGFTGLAATIGISVPMYGAVTGVIGAIAALAAVVMAEKKAA